MLRVNEMVTDKIDVTMLGDGDVVVIEEVKDITEDLVDLLKFMNESFKRGFHVVFAGADSRTAHGAFVRNMLSGLYEFYVSEFQEPTQDV